MPYYHLKLAISTASILFLFACATTRPTEPAGEIEDAIPPKPASQIEDTTTPPPADSTIELEDFEPARPLKKSNTKVFGVDLEIEESEQSREQLVVEEEPETPPDEPIVRRDLVRLFELEIAAQYNYDKEGLIDDFIDYAVTYQDASVAARAYEVAQETYSSSYALTTARLWYSLDESSSDAQEAYIKELILQSQYSEAFELMGLRHIQDQRTDFRLMAIFAQPNNENEARQLIALYQQYLENYPELKENLSSGMQLGYYQLGKFLFYQAELEQSLRIFNLILSSPITENELEERATTFKARLYYLLDRDGTNAFYNQAIKKYPNNIQIPVFHALLLIQKDREKRAQDTLIQLFNKLTAEGDQRRIFVIAYLAQQLKLDELEELALSYYQSRISQSEDAAMRLGTLSVAKGANSLAEEFFQLIGTDSSLWQPIQLLRLKNLIQARDLITADNLLEEIFQQDEGSYFSLVREYALSLAESGLEEPAIAILEKAESKRPPQQNLKLTKAYVYYELNKLEAMVAEFEQLLSQNDDDPSLLNGFGYCLSDKNLELDRAKEMIEQAVAQSPTNSAYVDSLGWVNYRLNNLNRAYDLLDWAYSNDQDSEIAAHLGEVLWQLGRKERARIIWLTQYEKTPHSSVLLKTMTRFGINPYQLAPHSQLLHPDI